MIRYVKIVTVDGERFILRVTSDHAATIRGIEVDTAGEEIVPRGTVDGQPFHNRMRIVQKSAIKRSIEMRMNNTYATLEPVP